MGQAAQIINSKQLRTFAPIGKLTDDDARELLRTAITVKLSSGTPLFSDKDNNGNQLFYLIAGKIEFCSAGKTSIIEAETKEARMPIGRQSDKHASAIAVQESTLLSFDADMLDLFLNWTNPNAYLVSEHETNKDHEWLNRLLKSRGLLRFSEQQINTLLDRMNEVHFNKGDVVISQDDDDEFYYVIKKGSATVSRKPSSDSKGIKLAELGEGDAFGEESILSQSNRGATITMKESGNLMRLSKQDFSELLAQPLLETISWGEAQAMVATGAEFIDIRLEEEFNELHVPGSRNIPLPLLRLKLKQFNQRRKYIVCCNDGSRSSVAAFLLNRHGFDAFILDGGMTTFISQMANSEMNKLSADTELATKIPAAEVVIASSEQGNQFCSLAEHWGDTVAEINDDGFADDIKLHQLEKTTVTKATNQAVATTEYKRPKQNPTAVERNVFQAKNDSNEKLFRNILLGIILASLAATIAMYSFATNEKGAKNLSDATLLPTTEKTAEPTPPPIEDIDTTANNTTTAITPMTRFVPPIIENTIVEPTTELVDDADTHLSDAEILEPQPSSQTTNAIPVAVDPATRGFIE